MLGRSTTTINEVQELFILRLQTHRGLIQTRVEVVVNIIELFELPNDLFVREIQPMIDLSKCLIILIHSLLEVPHLLVDILVQVSDRLGVKALQPF